MKASDLEPYMIPCINKKIFGIECLGCGMQRATALLFTGEFAAAFKIYPAIYPLLLLLCFLVLNFFMKFRFAYPIKISLILITAVTVIVSYLIKMQIFF